MMKMALLKLPRLLKLLKPLMRLRSPRSRNPARPRKMMKMMTPLTKMTTTITTKVVTKFLRPTLFPAMIRRLLKPLLSNWPRLYLVVILIVVPAKLANLTKPLLKMRRLVTVVVPSPRESSLMLPVVESVATPKPRRPSLKTKNPKFASLLFPYHRMFLYLIFFVFQKEDDDDIFGKGKGDDDIFENNAFGNNKVSVFSLFLSAVCLESYF
jgi:hypothetical protein